MLVILNMKQHNTSIIMLIYITCYKVTNGRCFYSTQTFVRLKCLAGRNFPVWYLFASDRYSLFVNNKKINVITTKLLTFIAMFLLKRVYGSNIEICNTWTFKFFQISYSQLLPAKLNRVQLYITTKFKKLFRVLY